MRFIEQSQSAESANDDGQPFIHNLINRQFPFPTAPFLYLSLSLSVRDTTNEILACVCVCSEFESGIHAEIMQLSVAQQNQIVCAA